MTDRCHLLVLAIAAIVVGLSESGCNQGGLEGYRTIAEPTEDALVPPEPDDSASSEDSASDSSDDRVDSADSLTASDGAANESPRADGPPSTIAQADASPRAETERPTKDDPTSPPAPSERSSDPLAAVSKAQPAAEQPTEPITSGSSAPLSNPQPTDPLVEHEIMLLVAEKSFRAEGPEDALRVSYDDIDLLKILNMEPVPPDAAKHFPVWLNDLDGRRIRIRGFMYPPYEETGLKRFLLARDNQICCFGRQPKIYDVFPVTMREGETTDYIQNRPFDVVGTFRIQPESDGGELFQLYLIDDAVVID